MIIWDDCKIGREVRIWLMWMIGWICDRGVEGEGWWREGGRDSRFAKCTRLWCMCRLGCVSGASVSGWADCSFWKVQCTVLVAGIIGHKSVWSRWLGGVWWEPIWAWGMRWYVCRRCRGWRKFYADSSCLWGGAGARRSACPSAKGLSCSSGCVTSACLGKWCHRCSARIRGSDGDGGARRLAGFNDRRHRSGSPIFSVDAPPAPARADDFTVAARASVAVTAMVVFDRWYRNGPLNCGCTGSTRCSPRRRRSREPWWSPGHAAAAAAGAPVGVGYTKGVGPLLIEAWRVAAAGMRLMAVLWWCFMFVSTGRWEGERELNLDGEGVKVFGNVDKFC